MKKKLILSISFEALFVAGSVAGAIVQHLRDGYWYKALKSESYPFPDGEVTLTFATESIGMPFLDPETSVLTLKTRKGLPVTIYKAKRVFQELYPHVKGVKCIANQITWQDGLNTYHLTVTPIDKKVGQPVVKVISKSAASAALESPHR